MISFIGMTKRNMLVYLKDRQAVIFSMITPIIVFVLYLLFLRGTFIDALENYLDMAKGFINENDIDMFANLLLLSGVIGSSVITVSYSSLTTIVSDKQNKIDYDISATPVTRVKIIVCYLIAAFINSFIISAILLTGGLIIVSLLGDAYLSFINVLALYGITLLGSLSATTILMILVILFKTTNSAGAFQGLLCAAVGFIIGAYIPISQFSTPIQTICNLFPGSHITALYRNVLLNGVIENMNSSMNGLDNGSLATVLKEVFSVNLNMFDNYIMVDGMLWYVLAIIIASLITITILFNKLYKRK